MRIIGRLATSTVAAGLVAGLIVAAGPAARATASELTPTAHVTSKTTTSTTTTTAKSKTNATSNTSKAPSGIRAPYAELANEINGADLWSRSSVSEHPMGSITKVMTAYMVIEAGNLNRVITVPSGIVAYDRRYNASTAGLAPGEKLTALQLLYGLMLPSGCDAAFTLATAYGKNGSRTAFIAAMNTTAHKLGLSKTHFSDFSGLPDPTEYSTYSTARDLVSLGRDAMKLAVFRQIVGTRTYRVPPTSHNDPHVWTNLNHLLGHYTGASGIKTGWTTAAGNCLLFAATRGKKELVGVVLDSAKPDTTAGMDAAASDAAAMLSWGFSR
ncbi:MAG TPA: D-alanyl-D-alanine carboxypeptidase [Trebonia sp.]|jgi:D-alanyl-D-alanine carboxypeptidase (penicillin-binding protein 5/6)|nr:D-alanyl-D-alanine carboxypeptidase [Trebonia sp.]